MTIYTENFSGGTPGATIVGGTISGGGLGWGAYSGDESQALYGTGSAGVKLLSQSGASNNTYFLEPGTSNNINWIEGVVGTAVANGWYIGICCGLVASTEDQCYVIGTTGTSYLVVGFPGGTPTGLITGSTTVSANTIVALERTGAANNTTLNVYIDYVLDQTLGSRSDYGSVGTRCGFRIQQGAGHPDVDNMWKSLRVGTGAYPGSGSGSSSIFRLQTMSGGMQELSGGVSY